MFTKKSASQFSVTKNSLFYKAQRLRRTKKHFWLRERVLLPSIKRSNIWSWRHFAKKLKNNLILLQSEQRLSVAFLSLNVFLDTIGFIDVLNYKLCWLQTYYSPSYEKITAHQITFERAVRSSWVRFGLSPVLVRLLFETSWIKELV